VQRALENRSIHVGPVVSALAVMLGLESYGGGGAMVGFTLAVLLAAVADEFAPTDYDELTVSDLTAGR
jgi:hypothetical protein